MVYAYHDENVRFTDLDDLLENDKYKDLEIDKYYVTKLYDRDDSGKTILPTNEEDVLTQLLHDCKKGDIVITSSLTSFSTETLGMILFLEMFIRKEVRILSILESFDSNSTEGTAFITAIPIIRNYRGNCIKSHREARMAGINKAKKEGKFTGRKPLSVRDFENFESLYRKYCKRKITKGEFAKSLGISRPSLDKFLNNAIEIKNGDVFYPDDWIYLDVCDPSEATEAFVIAFKNRKKFDLPYFIFLTTDSKLDPKTMEKALQEARRVHNEFDDLCKKYPNTLNVLGNGFTEKELQEEPCPGFFRIPTSGEYYDFPFGAMVIKERRS